MGPVREGARGVVRHPTVDNRTGAIVRAVCKRAPVNTGAVHAWAVALCYVGRLASQRHAPAWCIAYGTHH